MMRTRSAQAAAARRAAADHCGVPVQSRPVDAESGTGTPSSSASEVHASYPGRAVVAAAGAAALAFLVAFLASSAPEGPADTAVNAETAQRYYVDHAMSLELAGFFAALGAGLLVVLAALLRRVIRAFQPDGVLADVTFAAGCLLAVDAWIYSAIFTVGDEAADVDPQMTLGWYGLQTIMEKLGDSSHVFRALFVGAVALAAYRAGFLPRWLAFFGLFTAAMCLVGELGGVTNWGGFVVTWFAGLIGFLLWLPMLGVTLLLRSRRRAADPPAPS